MTIKIGDRFDDGLIYEVVGNITPTKSENWWYARVEIVDPKNHHWYAVGEILDPYDVAPFEDKYLGNFSKKDNFNELYDLLNS